MALVAWSLLAATTPLQAQRVAASPDGLRLGTLYSAAERANPRIAAANALVVAAEARVPGTRRPPDPQVQLGLMNRSLPGLGPMDPLGMTQLQVMQMLPTAGKLGLAGAAADARVGGARARATDLRWEVRSQVAAAFYEVYRTERSISIARQTRQLMQDVASTSEAMFRVGETVQADVLKAQVEVARMTEDITAMQAMRAVNLARLSGLLDQPIDSTAGDAVLPAFPRQLPTPDSLMVRAAARRPMVQAGEADVRAAEAEARLATREIWPDLQVGVQYGQRGGMNGQERMGSLMIGASVPIWARSRQYRMRDETEAMRAMAAADLAAMRADTRARVGVAYAEWSRARNLRSLYETAVLPQARAAVAAAMAAYRVGRVNLMTVLDNQATVNRYEQELAALDAAEGMTLADMEMLLGQELFDSNAGRTTPGGK
ncbi:MAG: TolC family protein [Gemmatimonadetes bacterium]|nr:TolC family protein [Gemmatimonadota bacterium]